MSELAGKNVLVTGGCGSIGSELVEQILAVEPTVVRILDDNEAALFNLRNRFGDHGRIRYLLGDVRDRDRITMAMEGIDVVFHSAALKHVELTEYNPFEAIQTNVHGTQNLIRAGLEEEIESFVTISTDKASNPISVMGATKLLSERLVIAANAYKGNRDTRFGCVRFGNVLGSRGSVIPLLIDQIREGGPVTVTNPEMTRFVMSIEKAVGLVLNAHERMDSGEVFVLKMPSLRIGDLAEVIIEEYAPKFGFSTDDISVEIVGSRPAERTHEKLISNDECSITYEMGDMYVILPQIDIPDYEVTGYTDATPVDEEYTSESQELLSKEEIASLITSLNNV